MKPRILVIDDLLGRQLPAGRNPQRMAFCAAFLLEDVTGDHQVDARIPDPVAQAYFCRGQKPVCSAAGDVVENDLKGIIEIVQKGWSKREPGQPPWCLVLVDLCFKTGRVTVDSNAKVPGMPEGKPHDDRPSNYFGLDVLKMLREQFPQLPVAILSTRPRGPVAESYARLGAVDFLAPDQENPAQRLRAVIQSHGLIPDDKGAIVGHSIPLLIALRNARRAASGDDNVLLHGERGTGKELVAHYIHNHRLARRSGPLLIAQSSDFTSELYATELFGIEKRTASGVDQRKGLIREADKGDLFLDEVANMPTHVQQGLLRVLQERTVRPVGSTKQVPVDVCFLFASNYRLDKLTQLGNFRADLFDRMRRGGDIWLPPLRERREDISLLIEAFLRRAEARFNAVRREVLPEVIQALSMYDWPGNVRELEGYIQRAVRDFPNVERLALPHLPDLRAGGGPISGAELRPVGAGHSAAPDLEHVIELLGGSEVDAELMLKGGLRRLQEATAKLIKAALQATGRKTVKNPDGEILIHPAMKLLMDDDRLTASQAADLIKRYLKPLFENNSSLSNDPILQAAFSRAERLRPSKRKQ